MDYKTLLDVATDVGYRLAMSGAETFRVEDTIGRILGAYNIDSESFAIPNYLIVSIKDRNGQPMTQMRRIGYHGNDLDAVEKYSNLSRTICSQKPDAETALALLKDVDASRQQYGNVIYLLGNFLGALGFAILFGGTVFDCLCSGLCGIIIGIVNMLMDRLRANQFFRIIISAFLMAVPAYFLGAVGIADNTDAVIIGALMILVPGLIFTNAMRDIIYGDTNSGINRIVHVFLIAVAIALGTGAAWSLACILWGSPTSPAPIDHPLWFESIACMISGVGFLILFNVHGRGGFLCALGGVLAWIVFSLSYRFTGDDILAYFFATATASVYSEVMARLRKCPTTPYLVVSAFPLIPGAGVYHTMNYAVRGDWQNFVTQGMHTISIAGVMAVGILLVSTITRFFTHVEIDKRI